MSQELQIESVATVYGDYKWDKGVPISQITDLNYNKKADILNWSEEFFSPFTSVTVLADVSAHSNSVAFKKIIDFGDYYNYHNNIVTSSLTGTEKFCHTYIMPGTYMIKMTVEDYIKLDSDSTANLYKQPTNILKQQLPIFWQWCNFSCNPTDNLRNQLITWDNTSNAQRLSQQEREVCSELAEYGVEQLLRWSDVQGPCIKQPYKETSWKWENQTCNVPLLTSPEVTDAFSWKELQCASCDNRTWSETTSATCYERPANLSATSVVYSLADSFSLITVQEIMPNAYIEVEQFPNTGQVRLSPRFSETGSFPIEQIDWDLGDGSSILKQRRWDVNKSEPFVYNNSFPFDWEDPRNYDILYSYAEKNADQNTFYPSLTVYASSTKSSNCVKGIVNFTSQEEPTGPVEDIDVDKESLRFKKIKLTQNELTEHGKLLIGEVDGVAVAWRYDK